MSLKSVYGQLTLLESLSSTNAKKEILKPMLQDPLFLKVVKYTLDPRKKFKVKQFPTFKAATEHDGDNNSMLFEWLDVLSLATGANKNDKQTLYHLAAIDETTYEVVKRICNGDLRCGVGQRTINDVRPKTIPFTPYCRCSTKKKIHNIVYPAIIQEKANGSYAEMKVEGNKITFGTRDSKKIKQLKHLKKIFKEGTRFSSKAYHDIVYMGELRVWHEDGWVLNRQTGNGIINKCIQGTAKKSEAKRVFFSMWDAVSLKNYKEEVCATPYLGRFDHVVGLTTLLESNHFQYVNYKKVYSEEEAQEFANAIIKEGGEGGVLKNLTAVWGNKTSTEQIKLKARFEGELRAIRWEHGDKGKRHEHRMGRIIFETDDGLVRTAVGSGFSDKMREEDMDKHMGRIGELEYESLSKSKSRKSGDPEYALYGPATFTCWRDDKDVTDTLEDLKNR